LSAPVDAIDTPQAVLDNMSEAGQVSLIVGRGRLGLEWLKSIEPVANRSMLGLEPITGYPDLSGIQIEMSHGPEFPRVPYSDATGSGLNRRT